MEATRAVFVEAWDSSIVFVQQARHGALEALQRQFPAHSKGAAPAHAHARTTLTHSHGTDELVLVQRLPVFTVLAGLRDVAPSRVDGHPSGQELGTTSR